MVIVSRRCANSVFGRNTHLWNPDVSALQTLHKASSKARAENYFQGGLSHDWVDYYESRIESDRSCLNEWHAMDDLESRRPPSPDSIRTKPRERDETEKVIRSTLKEIMMSVDLDEVTSKYIRNRLEEELDMDLGEYKSFIDQEMLTILGQMDAPTEIFDHVYLGSEWNASNYEELQKNGIRHILNVTREIDNFFPGNFDYLNVRVYDDEKTDLLKYWDNTYKYITKAQKEGSKVLVHCKMGVSRSASVVIAYAMKAYNWDFKTALRHVKEKRSCIKPNASFVSQLETYQGILDAMKNKEKLQRSKSETNLKSGERLERSLPGSRPTPLLQALSKSEQIQNAMSGQDLRHLGMRPKSWSPDNAHCRREGFSGSVTPFRSLENLNRKSLSKDSLGSLRRHKSYSKSLQAETFVRNVLLPCDNGESYSVSPNQIRHLDDRCSAAKETSVKVVTSVRQLVNEYARRQASSAAKSPSPNRLNSSSATEPWDPGEADAKPDDGASRCCDGTTTDDDACDLNKCSSDEVPETVREDTFSNQVDRVFEKEERKPPDRPSRQNSWSSYDSAVVLCYQGETRDNVPSRHSSWGSGDTRTLPSRNSSWGSYDTHPAAGLVYYTNERGEKTLHPSCKDAPVEAVNPRVRAPSLEGASSPSAISAEIDISRHAEPADAAHARLSVSAPETSTLNALLQDAPPLMTRSASSILKPSRRAAQPKTVVLLDKRGSPPDDPPDGKVRSLKREFESKTTGAASSVPGSPISVHVDKAPCFEGPDPSGGDDLNLKRLIGKFELNSKAQVTLRPKSFNVGHRSKSARFSCIEVSPAMRTAGQTPLISSFNHRGSTGGGGGEEEFKRPPAAPTVRGPSPNVVVATVIAKAARKQQQFGKSHPLARLNIKPRHNNPVYNTM